MEEQLLNEAIEKCMADSTSIDDLIEILYHAHLVIA